MSGPTPESTHASSTSEHECRNVIVTESGARVCADTGVVIDDNVVDTGPEWRAYTPEEVVAREHAILDTLPSAGSGVYEDERLAVLNAHLLHGDRVLLDRADLALRTLLGDDWYTLRDSIRHGVRLEVARVLKALADRGVRLTPCTVAYVAYVVARRHGWRVKRPCKPRRVVRHAVERLGLYIRVVPREEAAKLLDRCAERLGADPDTRRVALNILRELVKLEPARHPKTLAAAALYIAGKATGMDWPQERVAKTCGSTDTAMRHAIHRFLERYDVVVLLGS